MSEHLQDKGFKRVFSKKKYFLRFLQRYLSENFVEGITEENLHLENGEYNNVPRLRRLESDIIYSVNDGVNCVYFYISLELQSKNDFSMPYRMLLYLTERIRADFDTEKLDSKRQGYRAPAVVPIVFYSGRKPWTALKRFKDYTYQGDKFGNRIIDFEYELISLRDLPEDFLKSGNSGLDAILIFAQNMLNGDQNMGFQLATGMTTKIPRTDRRDLIDFVYDVYENIDEEKKEKLCLDVEEGDDATVTAAMDDLRQMVVEQELKKLEEGIEVGKREGIKEGKREGIKEGEMRARREMARRMLHSNLQMDMIMEYTGLTASEIEKLKEETTS